MDSTQQAVMRINFLIEDKCKDVQEKANNNSALKIIGDRINHLLSELAKKDAEIAELKKDDPKS